MTNITINMHSSFAQLPNIIDHDHRHVSFGVQLSYPPRLPLFFFFFCVYFRSRLVYQYNFVSLVSLLLHIVNQMSKNYFLARLNWIARVATIFFFNKNAHLCLAFREKERKWRFWYVKHRNGRLKLAKFLVYKQTTHKIYLIANIARYS